MKIITINGCRQAGTYDFKGLSTDEKPTNCGINSLFYELDTGDFYYFDGVWKKVNSKVQLEDTAPSGTIEITENGTVDVYDYDYADVNVPGVIPTGTLPIKENGNVDVANYATAEVDVDYVTVGFNLPALARSTPTALSQARDYLAATNVGNYALFGGGHATGSSYYSKVVDAYGTSLTRTTPTVLSKGGEYLAATSVGNYALFGGGNSGGSATNRVDAYDTSLIRTTPTALSQSRESLAATNVGNYALFGGGWLKSIIDAYDTSLTRTTPTELSEARSDLAATNIGNYALFGGGDNGKNYSSSTVDAYDATLTRTTPTKLSQSRMDLAATTVVPAGSSNPQSGYALFGGGRERIGNRIGNYFSTVDSYDATLTKTTPTPTALSQAMSHLIATTVGNYALFGGGWNGNSCLNVIDAYDTSLTRSTPTELSQARSFLAATTIGDYALFGGGYDDSTFSAVVDAYSPVSSYNIQLFPDTKYSFNSSTEQISSTMQTITMEPPIVGYIKIKNTTVT